MGQAFRTLNYPKKKIILSSLAKVFVPDAALGGAVLSLRNGRVGFSGAYRAGGGNEDGHYFGE